MENYIVDDEAFTAFLNKVADDKEKGNRQSNSNYEARKEWQKDPALKCKSVFLSKFTNDEGYRYDQENDTAADILVTGVIPKEYQIYEPTIEDQIADDWAVVTVHNSKVVDKYL